MRIRRRSCWTALILCLAPAAVIRADKLDKDSKKWLDQVKPIMLPEEEKTFRELKDKSDRDEFRKIFWARRDPDLETPENEYQAQYEKARAEAEAKFRGSGRGADSDCGRLYILLGPPDDVKKEMGGEEPGSRASETWTFKDRPGMKFTGGQAQIALDENCQFPQGSRLGEQLVRVAEGKIAHPNIAYPRGSEGRLVKLADQLPKPSPATSLLKTPRQDFPTVTRAGMVLRSPGGATYLAGLVRAEPGALAPQDEGGRMVAKAVVAIQALDESGKPAASAEREVTGELLEDGSFVASYGVALKPGRYDLKVGLLDPRTGKGSVASQSLEVPDFSAEELSISPVLVLRDILEKPTDPKDPLSSFQLGPMRLLPAFNNVFSQKDSVTLLAFIYNPKVDEATGKPSTTASFAIMKDGKPLAKAPEQSYDTPGAGPSVGPVSLEKYPPGKYVAQVKVRDNVAKKDYVQEATFEVK